MNNQSITVSPLNQDILSSVVLNGDLSKLSSIQKVQYYVQLCERVGLDPATQPFKLLKLNNREILYADKGATQQLCKTHNVSTEVTKKEKFEDVYVVTVRAKDDKGRFTDEDGCVTIGNLKGDFLANALMKAVTKAKRRAVLALCGLGMLDESEIETIPGAESVKIPNPAEVNNDVEPTVNPSPEPPQFNQPEPPTNGKLITEKQGKRLIAIAMSNGYTKDLVKEYVKSIYGYEKLSLISRSMYDQIVGHFQSPKEEGVSNG